MPTARLRLAAAPAPNRELYATGGATSTSILIVRLATVEEYDPATNTWATKASMPTARSGLGVAAAPNGNLYAIGGAGSTGFLTTAEEYDPATNTWATKAPMPTARDRLGVAAAPNGKLYATGGDGSAG